MPGRCRRVSGHRGLPVVAAAALLLGGCPLAWASDSSEVSADQILAKARSGSSAAQILATAFPAASLKASANPLMHVLVADLAPRVTVAAHGHPVLVAGSGRISLVADHRYEASRTRAGWAVRDLDARTRVRRLRSAVLRFEGGTAESTVLLAEPLGVGFRGGLVLRSGERRTISVVNVVRLEQWLDGAVGGDLPSSWDSAPAALDFAAILLRSRALGAIRSRSPGWDLTAEDPRYMGVDGEQSELKAAADRTDRQAAWTGDAPLDAVITFTGDPTAPLRLPAGPHDPVAGVPAHPIPGAAAGLGPRAAALVAQQLGTPYVWGGSAPGGFDCSGLVAWIYGRLGIRLPRVAEDQARVGAPVADADLQPGDVLFFADSTGYVHHEGIYIGGDRMIHAPQSGDVVKVERIDIGSFARTYAGARRFSPSA